jgi:protein ImuA
LTFVPFVFFHVPMRTERIQALKAALAKPALEEREVRVPLGCAEADAYLKGGLVKGALHEVFAATGHEASATGFAAGLAARVANGKPVLWIRQDFSALEFGELAATGLLELGIDPSRFLILRVQHAEDALRAASDALTCSALGAVAIEMVGEHKVLDLKASRRLTLGAAEKGVSAFLLRFSAVPEASSAETRWLIRAARSRENEENWGQPVFEAGLVRNRHGRTGHWVMEWNCDERGFREAADRGAVVSAPFDRPADAAMEGEARRAIA